MANLKETYSDFEGHYTEGLHRTDVLKTYNDEMAVYNGNPEDAPPSAKYVWQEVINIAEIEEDEEHPIDRIEGALQMPIINFYGYGETYVEEMGSDARWLESMGTSYNDRFYTLIHAPRTPGGSGEVITVQYAELMNSLPDGTRDVFDYQEKKIYRYTKWEELSGTRNWRKESGLSDDNFTVYSVLCPLAPKDTINLWCSHFTASTQKKNKKIQIKNGRIYVTLSTSLSIGQSLDKFRDWLNTTEVNIIYPRKNMVTEIPGLVRYRTLYTLESANRNHFSIDHGYCRVVYRVAPNARLWERQEDGSFIEL